MVQACGRMPYHVVSRTGGGGQVFSLPRPESTSIFSSVIDVQLDVVKPGVWCSSPRPWWDLCLTRTMPHPRSLPSSCSDSQYRQPHPTIYVPSSRCYHPHPPSILQSSGISAAVDTERSMIALPTRPGGAVQGGEREMRIFGGCGYAARADRGMSKRRVVFVDGFSFSWWGSSDPSFRVPSPVRSFCQNVHMFLFLFVWGVPALDSR